MLDRVDWDTFWRWERFRRSCDPLDFRRWKRDSSRALRGLFPGEPGAQLLDSTAGLGDHTVNLAEEGFRVEACDESDGALVATREAVREAGVSVEVFRARWEALGAERPGRYDLVFNDALHWVYDAEELHRVLVGLRGALRPGGALVFFFADERDDGDDAGRALLEWDWGKLERASLAWEHEREGTRVSLTVVNERGEDWIDQHHLFVVREPGARARLESFTQRRVYRWHWRAMRAALARAGFGRVRCEHFENVKGYTYAMNLAYRDA
jgi:SAM-dependent methyltransferase